eukprot:UN18735
MIIFTKNLSRFITFFNLTNIFHSIFSDVFFIKCLLKMNKQSFMEFVKWKLVRLGTPDQSPGAEFFISTTYIYISRLAMCGTNVIDGYD